MTSNEFVVWMQELIANSDSQHITPYQSNLIKNKLSETGATPQIDGGMPEYVDPRLRMQGIPSNGGIMEFLQAMEMQQPINQHAYSDKVSNYIPADFDIDKVYRPDSELTSSEELAEQLAEGNELHRDQYFQILKEIEQTGDTRGVTTFALKQMRADRYGNLTKDTLIPESQQIKNNRATMKVVHL